MRIVVLTFVMALTAAGPAHAAVAPAAQLLPTDTLALVSVPDWDQLAAYWKECAQGRLWRDSALKPFRDKVLQKWQDDYAGPLERQLGVKLNDYLDLLHGQVTFAVTRHEWNATPSGNPGLLLLIDVKDKEPALQTRLAELKRKWTDAGKHLKTDKVRDLDFTTFIVSTGDLKKNLPHAGSSSLAGPEDEFETLPDTNSRPEKSEIIVGQSGPLLIVGNNLKDIEKIVAGQTGGLVSGLAEQAAYVSNRSVLREALALAWVNVTPIFETIQKRMSAAAKEGSPDNPFSLHLDNLAAASGLAGVSTVAGRLSGNAEGTSAEVFLNVPEARRRGLFAALSTEHKEAAPPPFVGADVVKFKRWRADGPKLWTTLENLITAVSPEIGGLLQMGFQAAGKDRDPNFDLKKALVGNLGDDFISFEKNPRPGSDADLSSAPSLFLVGSPNAAMLVQGLRAGTALMPLLGGDAGVREREFLGHKIYSVPLSPEAGTPSKNSSPERTLNFAASGGYAAISSDPAVLEEFLRSGESTGKTLRETPGLMAAAEKVGGTSTGLFGYENQAQTVRHWLESAQSENAAMDKLLSLGSLTGGNKLSPEDRSKMKGWFDVALLPPFEKIASYFHLLVYSLNTSNEGFTWKMFLPTPPRIPDRAKSE